METSKIFLLFLPILLANPSATYILRNEEEQGEVACDPAANPSDCPHDRQCKDLDGDGQSTCVCDSRYYTTHTSGHCVLGLKELVYDMEKELGALELKQQHDNDWLNDTMNELLLIPTTTTTTTTPAPNGGGLLLVVSGHWTVGGLKDNSQVVDIITGTKCSLPPSGVSYPFRVSDGTGTTIDGIPLICGGYIGGGNYLRECYTFDKTSNSWSVFANMIHGRAFNSGSVLNGKFWVTGGYTDTTKESTELISMDGTVEAGPNLPSPGRWGHSMVTLHDGRVMILGDGTDPLKNKVSIYDSNTDTFEDGPDLIYSREHAGAILFRSAKHNNRHVVLVAGGKTEKVEVFDYTTASSWEEITSLPTDHDTQFHQAVASTIPSIYGDGAILQHDEYVYELTCTAIECSWSISPVQLDQAVYAAVMLHLPTDYVNCNN